MPFILEKTISQTFLKRVRTTPDLVGFVHKSGQRWKEWTFREFFSEAQKISAGLMSLGVKKGDPVAILSNTRIEWSLCDMAILGTGAVTIPIYPSNTAEDVGYILQHSKSLVLFVEDEIQLQKILALRALDSATLANLQKVVILDRHSSTASISDVLSLNSLKVLGKEEASEKARFFEENLRSAKPSDTLSIVYTSGTTGTPKGVILTHENAVSVIEDCLAILSGFSEPESETVLSFLPFSHILGKLESISGYTFGWKQGFAESIEKLPKNMLEVRPTLLFSVPRTFEKAWTRIQNEVSAASYMQRKLFSWAVATGQSYFSALQAKKMPSPRDFVEYRLALRLVFKKILIGFGGRLRYVICGGAPLSRELGEFFEIAGIKILEGYGLTETCGPITVNTPDYLRFGTVGRPLADVSIRVAEDGELEVKSRKIFSGYFQAPEETQQVFTSDGWFKTGDIGFIDDQGFIHLTDRKKDLIVTAGGKNIAPQKIEKISKEHPWLNQLVVIGDRRPYLVALITLNRELAIQTASEKGILFSEYRKLIQNPKVLSMTHSVIEKINSRLGKHEVIKKFLILPNEFSIESGELTPSLKIKRKLILSRYWSEIDLLYQENSEAQAHP